MDFAVLGPLVVRRDGDPIELPAMMERRLLATLLTRPDQVTPLSQVLDELWGPQPPTSARKTAQIYVHRLRTGLGDPARIEHVDGGYRLRAAAAEVDAMRFRDHLDLARAAQRSADPNLASDLFASALGLWRGEAYAGLAGGAMIGAEAARLEMEREQAMEDWFAVDLTLGRHRERIGALWDFTEAHPFREQARAFLMLALYRSGRQADALAVYRNTQTHLDTELGVEPSRLLQGLHAAMLRAEPRLDEVSVADLEHWHHQQTSTAGGSLPSPAQLPGGLVGFTGRADSLARLDALLAGATLDPPAVVISAIGGAAGIGKTALAIHWARRVADRFPDGQLYVNLRGFDLDRAIEPSDAVRGFLVALGVAPVAVPSGLDAQSAMLRTLLAGRRVLVILDNARDSTQVRPLLPASPGSLAVITSRRQLRGLVATAGAHPISLDLLGPDDAQELLTARLGADRIEAEPAAVREIITMCAGLPLALAIVAARASTAPQFPLAVLAEALREARLDALSGPDGADDLRSVLSWSYHALTPPTARMFRLLAMLPRSDVSITAAASLVAQSPAQARRLLSELADAHLVTEHAPRRFSVHDLVRDYAAELTSTVDCDADRHSARERLLDHYVHTATAAALLIYPHRHMIAMPDPAPGTVLARLDSTEDALEWSRAEHDVLLAAVDQAAATGFEAHAWRLAWSLITYFDRHGHVHDQERTQLTALAASQRIGDRTGEANAYYGLGIARTWLSRYDEAEADYRRALEAFVDLPGHIGLAQVNLALAWMFERCHRRDRSLEHAQQALELHRDAGHVSGMAKALNTVGWHSSALGDHTTALSHCLEALALLQELGDRTGQADTWDSIGTAYMHLGDGPAARHGFAQAMRLYRETGDRVSEAMVLEHVGDACAATGDADGARAAWRDARDRYVALGHPFADEVRAKLTDQVDQTTR